MVTRSYYIYCPMGRAGSTRLTEMLTQDPMSIDVWEAVPDNITSAVIHSHNLHYQIPSNFTPILCTRKNKADIVLSNTIALKTKEWVPGWTPDNGNFGQTMTKTEIPKDWIPHGGKPLEPFVMNTRDYINRSKQLLLKEQLYIKKHNPIIIYLEDTVEDIEKKLQHKLPYPEYDKRTISKYPPKEYIINYKECLQAFEII